MPTTTVIALRVDVHGFVTIVDLGTDTLGGLYREIGCRTVEPVRLIESHTHALDMWADEEGLYAGAAVNTVGSRLAHAIAEHRLQSGFVGTLVFTSATGGEVSGLERDQLATLTALARGVGGRIPASVATITRATYERKRRDDNAGTAATLDPATLRRFGLASGWDGQHWHLSSGQHGTILAPVNVTA